LIQSNFIVVLRFAEAASPASGRVFGASQLPILLAFVVILKVFLGKQIRQQLLRLLASPQCTLSILFVLLLTGAIAFL